jgi:adenosylhomocysteine nucleosidase
MPSELRPLRRLVRLHRADVDDLVAYEGRLGGTRVVAALAGIGTDAARRATERVLDLAPMDHVVVVGIAGGIAPGVAVGDLVVPERVIDLASGKEHRATQFGVVSPRGALLTSDALLTDPAVLAAHAARGVLAVDMETSAVAAVCERRGCPWSVFRAISDRSEDGVDEAVLGLVHPDGSPNLPAVARFVLRRPRRIAQLVRLGRGMRRAAARAAQAAVEAIET